MLEDCISKRHSTFVEAAAEGRAMEAKFTMLTHFSQRYCKLPVLDEIEAETMNNLGIAFDGMTVSPATFEYIRLTYPALRTVFAEAIREMESKKIHFSTTDFSETVAKTLGVSRKSPTKSQSKKIRLDN
jgi:ribonuclease Z